MKHRELKIVLIGAGSAGFGQGTIADILSTPELRELGVRIVLVDIDQAALTRMHRLAEKLKEFYKVECGIESTLDRRKALPGADYVITSVATRRWDYWQKDFYIPNAYGFRQIYGEGAGPGAAFHTLRSLNLMIPIARDMEELCPEALLINFSNPESRVCLGVSRLTRIKVVGLCHGPIHTLARISEALGRPAEQIELTVGGINHFHWALEIRERGSGRDLYPELAKVMDGYEWDINGFTPLLYHLFGKVTYPAPSHPGEYLQFAHELAGPKMLEWGIGRVSQRLSSAGTDLDYVLEGRREMPSYELWSMDLVKRIDDFLAGKVPITAKDVVFKTDLTHPSQELAIPIICDIELDRDRRELAGNVVNRGFAVANLPEDAVVEVPLQVNAKGVHPVKVGPLPEALAGVCNLQISIMKLLVDAYHQKSKVLLLQALMIDPLVDSYSRARAMMETMLKVEADALPELH
jgi:alpha-galactosidase